MIDNLLTEIPTAEYQERIRRAQRAMQREGYDLLLAWSDSYRMSNVRWLANYRPYDGIIPYASLVVLPAKGEPTLLATGGLLSSAAASSWITDVRDIGTDLAPLLREYAAGGDIQRVGVGGYIYLALEIWDIIRAALPSQIAVTRTTLLDQLKSIKTEPEIRNMKAAGRLADIGCEAVEAEARVGATERELARAAYSAMFASGADGAAFDVFVQSGENSANYYLHRPTDRALSDGDVILVDMGCRVNGYASDNGRGVAFGSVPPAAQATLDTCLEAWEAGMRQLRPGTKVAEACASAHEVLARHGYLNPGQGGRCGHGTGMDPEEEFPSVDSNSEDVLAENQSLCFAITLLVPEVGGCRVEDPVIVRGDGPESLSNYPYRNHWPAKPR